MAVPCSGEIRLVGDIEAEFGNTGRPCQFTKYYGKAGAPSSGTLKFSDFRCASNFVFPSATNIVFHLAQSSGIGSGRINFNKNSMSYSLTNGSVYRYTSINNWLGGGGNSNVTIGIMATDVCVGSIRKDERIYCIVPQTGKIIDNDKCPSRNETKFSLKNISSDTLFSFYVFASKPDSIINKKIEIRVYVDNIYRKTYYLSICSTPTGEPVYQNMTGK